MSISNNNVMTETSFELLIRVRAFTLIVGYIQVTLADNTVTGHYMLNLPLLQAQ